MVEMDQRGDDDLDVIEDEAMPTPLLPAAPPRQPPPLNPGGFAPRPSDTTWYRTDQQRYRSVYRRANPWYRRLARGLIALSIVGVIGVAVFVGVTEANDYFQRDKLPGPAPESVGFRSTAFLVTSSAPAPDIDGTITIDNATRAFQFVGGVAGPQANTEVVSPDGTRTYIRVDGGAWQNAAADDPIVAGLLTAIPRLLGVVDSADVLLTNLRNGGYVDLVERSELGSDELALDRYEMLIDTAEFAADYPLQWQDLLDSVVPQMMVDSAVPLTMSIDANEVVVGLDDGATNWKWQRLSYSDTPFELLDPGP